jgi:hypothetical protein
MTPAKNTAARNLLESIGAPFESVAKQAHGNENPSATKRGPGRYHSAGHSKATPTKSKGAPRGFVLHTASPAKQQRRADVKAHGRRQANRMLRAMRVMANVSDAGA